MKGRKQALALLAVLAIGAGAAGCGDDEEDEGSGGEAAEQTTDSAEEVTVTTADSGDGWSWEVSATPTAETKSIEFVNDSKELHVLLFARINEGFTFEEALELEGEKGSATRIASIEAKPGAAATAEVKKTIEPGSYALLCPLATKDGTPHSELGQLEEFEIG